MKNSYSSSSKLPHFAIACKNHKWTYKHPFKIKNKKWQLSYFEAFEEFHFKTINLKLIILKLKPMFKSKCKKKKKQIFFIIL